MDVHPLHFILTVAVKPYKQASLAPSLICVIPYHFLQGHSCCVYFSSLSLYLVLN